MVDRRVRTDVALRIVETGDQMGTPVQEHQAMTPTDKPTQVGGLFVSDSIERLFSDAYACGLNCDPFDMLKARAIVNEAAIAYAQANVQALEARLVALEKDAARYLKLLSKAKEVLAFEEADVHWHDNGRRVSLQNEIDAALLESAK